MSLHSNGRTLIVPVDLRRGVRFFGLLMGVNFGRVRMNFPTTSRARCRFLHALVRRGLVPRSMAVRILARTERRVVHGAFRTIGNTPGTVMRICGSASMTRERRMFGGSGRRVLGVTISNTTLLGGLTSRARKGFRFRCDPRDFANARPRCTLRMYGTILSM